MKKHNSGDGTGPPRTISTRPYKIMEVFDETIKTVIKTTNFSQVVNALMIYLIKNKKNKKFVIEINKIRDQIINRRVELKPSF